MGKLEDKILKKVYVFETKRTTYNLTAKILGFIVLAFFIFVFGLVLNEYLTKQKTFDLFRIFRENFEVISKYFFDIFLTFYLELPKLITAIFLLLLILLFLLIYFVIKNYGVIKNRVYAIVKFWLRDGKKT